MPPRRPPLKVPSNPPIPIVGLGEGKSSHPPARAIRTRKGALLARPPPDPTPPQAGGAQNSAKKMQCILFLSYSSPNLFLPLPVAISWREGRETPSPLLQERARSRLVFAKGRPLQRKKGLRRRRRGWAEDARKAAKEPPPPSGSSSSSSSATSWLRRASSGHGRQGRKRRIWQERQAGRAAPRVPLPLASPSPAGKVASRKEEVREENKVCIAFAKPRRAAGKGGRRAGPRSCQGGRREGGEGRGRGSSWGGRRGSNPRSPLRPSVRPAGCWLGWAAGGGARGRGGDGPPEVSRADPGCCLWEASAGGVEGEGGAGGGGCLQQGIAAPESPFPPPRLHQTPTHHPRNVRKDCRWAVRLREGQPPPPPSDRGEEAGRRAMGAQDPRPIASHGRASLVVAPCRGGRGRPKMAAPFRQAGGLLLLGLILGIILPAQGNSSHKAVCQGYPDIWKEPQGQIRSPVVQGLFYSSCSWVILGGPEDIITIKFQYFHLTCVSEVLTIHSPYQSTQKICGFNNPEPLRIKGGNVTLSYSWNFMAGGEFLLKYERESTTPFPCNLTLDSFYGVIFSPAFASDSHLGAAQCQWALDAHDNRPLSIRFTVLDLDVGDSLRVYEGAPGATPQPRLLRNLDYTSNNKVVSVDSPTSRAWVTYQAVPGTAGRGFNATYHVRGFCVPWDFPCRGGDGEGATCYSSAERCDGTWNCANGADEEGCNGCPPGQYACGGRGIGGAVCYGPADRCNYQTFCADAADERHCYTCQPGNFRCRDGRCIYESWVCDGQADCIDASDEADCAYVLPRKVVTAAVIGSLVCGLLLVIALGCTCRLYALRSHEFSILAPMSRMEAQLIQRQAPPSYGQLIARGVIPPVEGFPAEHPNQNSVLGNLRSLLHMLRRDPATTPAPSGGRRPHRNRFVRRVVRRMRRLGLLPRSPPSSSSSTTATTSSAQSAADTFPEPLAGQESTTAGQEEEQAPPLPQKIPPTPSEPLPEAQGPPPSTSRPLSMMQTFRVRLFAHAPPTSSSEEACGPLSAPPSPDDDVLLVPLTDPQLQSVDPAEIWDADDEPLLT